MLRRVALPRIHGLARAVVASAFALIACGPRKDPVPVVPPVRVEPPYSPPALDSATTAQAWSIYGRHCALCHGDRGEGYKADHANALLNPFFLEVATDDFIRKAISEGRPGTPMSAWSKTRHGPLDDSEIEILVKWMRSNTRRRPVSLPAAEFVGDRTRGKVIYDRDCASCHGPVGQGTTAVSLANPNFIRDASDSFVEHVVLNGRAPTPMAAYRGRLSNEDIRNVAKYVRTLAPIQVLPNYVPGDPEPMPNVRNLVINPRGPAPTFTLRDDMFVSAVQLKAALDAGQRLVLLDARATSDWVTAHIPGAAPFPFYDVDKMAARLPKNDAFIVAYCACPHAASGRVVGQLRERGFTRTAVLDEGIGYWTDRRFPVARGVAPEGTPQPPHTDSHEAGPLPANPARPLLRTRAHLHSTD